MFFKNRKSVLVRIVLALVLIAGIIAVIPTLASSSVIYVKWDSNGANNGSSWVNAYTDLQSALAVASTGNEIWVAVGMYKPTAGTDRSVSFVLKNDVAIYGGFVGGELLLSQRNPAVHPTILSGDIGNINDNNDNSYHVVVGSSTNNGAVIDGFVVTGGNANDASPNDKGGGMYNHMGNPTVANVTFDNNSATFGAGMYNGGEPSSPAEGSNPILKNVIFQGNAGMEGGGMENQYRSSPSLTDVTFLSNTAARSGGGMLNYEWSRPTLTNVTFEGNTASMGGGMANWMNDNPILQSVSFNGNSADFGGGMANYSSSPSLTDVTFRGNTVASKVVTAYGGGMSNEDNSNPILENVTFDGNSAVRGGGMLNSQSSPVLTDVIFKDNSVIAVGGGMSNENYSNPTLTNVTFSGNMANDTVTGYSYGGGMANYLSSPTLTNVTFYNNTAYDGGGMLNREIGSNPTLTHVTFYNNTATYKGGAIANDGNMIVRNSILWGNHGGEIFNLFNGIPTVMYSIVQGGYTGTGNLDADPLLGPLQNNGGFAPTMALGFGSPAIDAGNDTNCPATDQRGVTRPQGSHCDIGAYEYETVATSTPTFTPTYTPTFTPTATVTFTPTYTPTNTPSLTPSRTPTATRTATVTPTPTATKKGQIKTPTNTPTSVANMTPTRTPTRNATSTPTKTPTKTPKKNGTFADVSSSQPYYSDIEILYANGLTGGCSTNPLSFCPDQVINRGQAAVFILRGNLGSGFVPGPPTHVFQDDWSKGTWAEPWAEAMRNEGLSSGCLLSPPKYCPWDQIPREQAVIFALRLKYGTNYAPPAATGTLFADMTNVNYYATAWTEQAYRDGLIPSCGTSGGKPMICPRALVSRGLAASMIVRAKNLTMP
jgi:predicted outer membrane repeat protein